MWESLKAEKMSSDEGCVQCAIELKGWTVMGAQLPLATLHLIKHLDVVEKHCPI